MFFFIFLNQTDLGKIFFQEPQSINASISSQLRLHCKPPEGEPVPLVFWFKDGQPIHSHADTSKNQNVQLVSSNSPSSSYSMKVLNSSNSSVNHRHRRFQDPNSNKQQNQSHESKNQNIANQKPTLSKKLQINLKPILKKANLFTRPTPTSLLNNEELIPIDSRLFADQFPSAQTLANDSLFELKLNSAVDITEEVEPVNFENYVLLQDHTLLIKELNFDDQGNFVCQAQNSAGIKNSNVAIVRLKGWISF